MLKVAIEIVAATQDETADTPDGEIWFVDHNAVAELWAYVVNAQQHEEKVLREQGDEPSVVLRAKRRGRIQAYQEIGEALSELCGTAKPR